jgi:hypothetical protein
LEPLQDEQLKVEAPDGIDVYFDNVGGETLEAAIKALRVPGRIIACGGISGYNAEKPRPGPSNLFNIVNIPLSFSTTVSPPPAGGQNKQGLNCLVLATSGEWRQTWAFAKSGGCRRSHSWQRGDFLRGQQPRIARMTRMGWYGLNQGPPGLIGAFPSMSAVASM